MRMAYALSQMEPNIVLEVGCGHSSPMGQLIAGMDIDTMYVGTDINLDYAKSAHHHNHLTTRRPFVGIACDANAGIPMIDESVDVVMCLEALEHFATTGAKLEGFFKEVKRVLQEWGSFWLATPVPGPGGFVQHPHCHEHEWSPAAIEQAADVAGMKITASWNYRARQEPIAQRLEGRYIPFMEDDFPAMVHAFTLPQITRGTDLLPGNAIYIFSS